MGRNYDKSLATLDRSLFFYGTPIVTSKDILVNVALNGKLLVPCLYPSSAYHLLDKTDSHLLSSRIVMAFFAMPQSFCNCLVKL